jgi:hypothetical protein
VQHVRQGDVRLDVRLRRLLVRVRAGVRPWREDDDLLRVRIPHGDVRFLRPVGRRLSRKPVVKEAAPLRGSAMNRQSELLADVVALAVHQAHLYASQGFRRCT